MTKGMGCEDKAKIQARVLLLMVRESSNLTFLTPVESSQSFRMCAASGKQYEWALWAPTLCVSHVPAATILAQPHLTVWMQLSHCQRLSGW